MTGWLWLVIGGLVGWAVLELDRLAYFKQLGLVWRTQLAAMVWLVVAVFAISSSGSSWASGLVLGVGLHLTYDFWRGKLVAPKWFGYGLAVMWVILMLWTI